MVELGPLQTIALLGSFLTGGIGLALFNRFSMSKKDQGDYLLMLVKQLQETVNSNNAEMQLLKSEVHQWRDKYYAELEEKNKLTNEVRQLRVQLQKFNDKTIV